MIEGQIDRERRDRRIVVIGVGDRDRGGREVVGGSRSAGARGGDARGTFFDANGPITGRVTGDVTNERIGSMIGVPLASGKTA